MMPERLGAMRQSPLSFVRPLVARATRERWQIERLRMDLDAQGKGIGVYRIETPAPAPAPAPAANPSGTRCHAVFFSECQSPRPADRAYEVDWDILVWLFDGEISDAQIEAVAAENTKLVRGTGRANPGVLSWTRANRSSRLVEHTVEQLAAGHQPDLERISRVGYLVRNIYYQANGMNGTRMFAAMPPGGALSGVFQVQMLGLYMIREFSFDLVEHMARCRSPRAVELDPALKRYLGVGNASGVGLNYLVTNHPKLMARWIEQRELALACIKLETPSPSSSENGDEFRRVLALLDRYRQYLGEDRIDQQAYLAPPAQVLAELGRVRDQVSVLSASSDPLGPPGPPGRFGSPRPEPTPHPWRVICERAETQMHAESQEVLHALLLEAHPSVCAAIESLSDASESMDVAYDMPIATFRDALRAEYDWAFAVDTAAPGAEYWNWYRSQDGDEPRVAPLDEDHIAAHYNIAVDLPALVQILDRRLATHPATDLVAHFLLVHPELRDLVENLQSTLGQGYAFVRMNMKHRDFSPLPLTRFVLQALKGMEKTSLVSNRWVRGTFLQGAPIAEDISTGTASTDWVYPLRPQSG